MDNRKVGAYLLLVIRAIKFIADVTFVTAIGVLLALFGLQFPHAAKMDSLWLIQKLHLWGDPALAGIASKFGWTWPSDGISYLPIAGGFILLAVKLGFDILMLRLTRLLQQRLPLTEQSLALSASDSSQGISVSSTLLALAAVSEKAMLKLQRRQVRVERRLNEANRRRCAFLAVGIVDDAELKVGADPEKVTRSFNAYQKMVKEVFQLTGAWKEAWTPDGVMVCYLDVGTALDAGQRVLKGLEGFNRELNELPHPFRVCCGLNEGEVVIFEDSKLQKVTDRVIDVAGHMAKNARPNTLWLSSEVYDRLAEKHGFNPANAQVDGFTVFEWRA